MAAVTSCENAPYLGGDILGWAISTISCLFPACYMCRGDMFSSYGGRGGSSDNTGGARFYF